MHFDDRDVCIKDGRREREMSHTERNRERGRWKRKDYEDRI